MAEKVVPISKFRAFASALVGRSRLAALAGKTFEGRRDLYKFLGYKRTIEFEDYWERYQRGGIAGRIVDAFPQATWRAKPVIYDDGKQPDDEQSDFVKSFNAMADRLKLFSYFERADKLAGVGSYSILLIGVKGAQPLDTPLPKLSSPDDILYVVPYSEGNAEIVAYEDNTSSERFGLPTMYSVSLQKSLSGNSTNTANNIKRVHHSRVIHIADNLVEDDILGIPRMQRVWNYLDDLEKIMGASAEAVWRSVDRGLHFNIDKDLELDTDDEADFVDEIEEYLHDQKRYIKTRGIEVNSLGGETVQITSPFDASIALISGTVGIPTRILLGSERGQLASQSDEKNFSARVRERQTSFAEPYIMRPFTNRVSGAFGAELPPYKVSWPDVSTLTDKENADVAARFGQAIKSVSDQKTIVMQPEDFRKRFIDRK